MQFKASALATLALAATALAQDLSGLPSCAQGAALGSISSSGCPLTDIKCICSNASFLSGLQTQIAAACPPADQAKAAAFAGQLCGSVGVTIPTGGAAGGSSSAAAAASTPASPATTTAAAVTTSYYAPVGTASGAPVPSGNGTIVTPPRPSSSVVTGGAAAPQGVQAGLALLVGVVGAVVAL